MGRMERGKVSRPSVALFGFSRGPTTTSEPARRLLTSLMRFLKVSDGSDDRIDLSSLEQMTGSK